MIRLPAYCSLPTLLAQRDNWVRLGDRFTGEHLELQIHDVVWGVALVAVFGAIVVALRVLNTLQLRTAEPRKPRRLFRELCDAHRLDRTARRRLSQLAASKRLRSKAELFVRPDLFEDDEDAAVLELRGRLFGEVG